MSPSPRRKAPKDRRKPRAQEAPVEIGVGPVGAMARWARLNRKLSFVFAPPADDVVDDRGFKRVLRRIDDQTRRRAVGVARQALSSVSKVRSQRLTKPPFTIAELPTRDLESLARGLGGKIPADLLRAAMAALLHGVPLVVSSAEELARARHLLTLHLRFEKDGEDLGRRFSDLCRGGVPRLIDSYGETEKPLLSLLDAVRERGRAATMRNKVRRHVESRRRWLSRGTDRICQGLVPCEADDPRCVIAFIDLLPLALMKLDSGEAEAIAQAFTTPLGLLTLGLGPALILPGDESKS